MIYRRSFITMLLGSAATAHAQGILNRRDDSVPPQVDLIYNRGLTYLSKSQNADGFWNDGSGDEPGVVGLCLAAFLASGTDPNNGEYSQVIKRGINYIISKQNKLKDNGYIGNSMYTHGFATKALAEAYGVVDNPKIGEALKKAVDLILSAQKRNPLGAWHYTPDAKSADTTVVGCQIVALFAARNAGFPIPDEAIRKGLAYMASCRGDDGSYGYTSPSGGRPTLTSIGILCLSLNKETDSKGYKQSLEFLKKNLDFRDRTYPFYFEYYMSQALFHADEAVWKDWNNRNIRYIGTIQSADGSFVGNHGQAFSTAGALLSLALNYRYLPIYEK
jgi:hypothetical protein